MVDNITTTKYAPPLCQTLNSKGGQYIQQNESLLCQILNSIGRQYNQPKHDTLLYPTTNSKGRQYNNHNMNHSSVKI